MQMLLNCPDRHPEQCKWIQCENRYKRDNHHDFMHVTLALKEKQFNCAGCKNTGKNRSCVVQHNIENMEFSA